MTMNQSTSTLEQNAKLNVLGKLCVDRLEDLLERLDVDLEVSGDKYIGCCPIHGDSDNPATLNIYYAGHTVSGYWRCRTRNCEKKFKANIIGFTRGRLSNLKLGYHHINKPDAVYGFPGTIDYLCRFVGRSLDSIKIDRKEQEKLQFIRECQAAEQPHKQNGTIHRDRVRKNLNIPAEYFLNRGFSKEILDLYDVGIPKKFKQENSNRVVVPIYDESNLLIGYSARSIFERCPKCKLFHKDECPTNSFEKQLCSKWRHNDFESKNHLYNYWRAKPFIQKSNTAILVEGPGDVWRLEESGIHNTVAMFGNTLYENQEKLLAKASTMSIIVLADNDIAGIEGAKQIKEKYGRLYRMYFPNLTNEVHDIGDLTEDVITEKIKPYIDKIMNMN